ncbi:MAG: PEGA domain-containing protein [Caldisericia bacterium]|nr:PEGA domain-containing protein [Caldisericia bacterium]
MLDMIIKERYKIYDKVGSGGMATVYIARDLITYEVVAVKILKDELTSSPNYIKRFLREAEIISNMSHENITKVKDFGVDNNRYFIVMEYVEGKTLSQLIEEKGKFEIIESIDIIIQILKALQYAKENGVEAHRDIKPQNIMINKDGVVKVMDFGIARVSFTHTMTQEGAFLGTPYYISPEQAQGKEVDIRSDIYSVGITLYQLINGSPPFDSDTPWGIINMHITKEPPPLNLPEKFKDLEYVIKKSLSKNKENRYQTPEEFIKDLILIKRGKLVKKKIEFKEKEELIEGYGEIFIKTDPENAKILINEEEKGFSPLLIENLSPKKYEIFIEKDGFENQKIKIDVIPYRRAVINVKLKRKIEVSKEKILHPNLFLKKNFILLIILFLIISGISFAIYLKLKPKVPINQNIIYASLMIKSQPEGLNIYIDGKDTGFKTPYQFNNLNAKNYLIEVKYKDKTKKEEVLLSNGDSKEIFFDFEEINLVTLKIETEPEGARIFIDDKDTNFLTPHIFSDISIGTHIIKLKLDGYEDYILSINITENKEIKVNLNKLSENLGLLKIKSEPSNCNIYINNELKGKSPMEINLNEGTYKIKLTYENYEDWEKEVNIKKNEEALIEANLKKKEIILEGTLNIDSSPKAKLYIDNTYRGQTPISLKLKEGSYRIKISLTGYEDYEKVVNIVGNEEQNIIVTLKKLTSKTYLKIITKPKGVEVYIDKILVGLSDGTFEVKPGKHEIILRLEGYLDYLTEVTLNEGDTKTIDVTLEKSP